MRRVLLADAACSSFLALIQVIHHGDTMAMLTVRQIDPADKAWLQREAARQHLSMEELVRRLIREKRQESMAQAKPSEIVRRHFGPRGGVDLGERARFGFQAADLRPQVLREQAVRETASTI
jgi:plasmid stability protein